MIRISRSFKKTPVYKDGSDRSKTRKYWKRQANKKVRKCRTALKKSNQYRKIGEQWDICDYRFYEKKPDNDKSERHNHWGRYYFRK